MFIRMWLVPVITVNVAIHWYMVKFLMNDLSRRPSGKKAGGPQAIDGYPLQTIIVSNSANLPAGS